ncbi:MAG: fumarylacetoacetate hydrolase family protein [Bdellovibrionota bacterium]
MKLGSLKDTKKDGPTKLDGVPVVVSKDNKTAVKVDQIVPSIREALENWDQTSPKLEQIYKDLNSGKAANSFKVDETQFHSPLPRSFHWVDGSAFVHHIKLVRKARNAPMPEDLHTVPLVYQGGSDTFLAPREDIPLVDEKHGLDFESEVGVITDFIPMGTKAQDVAKHIKLIVIINDVSLRGLIPEELARGFGFYQSKPSSSFAPFALTPDELGSAWQDGKVHLPLHTDYNGKFFGKPNANEMFFSFYQIIEHLALTRNLGAGTIVGSGTVSNENPAAGSSCLAEKRMIETIETGKASTPFMKEGDTVKIEMFNADSENLFGTILQKVRKFNPTHK